MSWRARVDPQIRNHLEKHVVESAKHKKAYMESKNPANSQLWVAIANLSREIVDVSLKLKYLEGTIKDLIEKENNILNQVNQQVSEMQSKMHGMSTSEISEAPKVEFIVDDGEKKTKSKSKSAKKAKIKRKKR